MRHLGVIEKRHSGPIILEGFGQEKITEEDDQTTKALFPDLTAKVAAQIHAISSYHPFVDGNKRTTLVTADVCLRLNGYRLTNSYDVESFLWSIARGEQLVADIESWVKIRRSC